jgi:hypothetical protein
MHPERATEPGHFLNALSAVRFRIDTQIGVKSMRSADRNSSYVKLLNLSLMAATLAIPRRP